MRRFLIIATLLLPTLAGTSVAAERGQAVREHGAAAVIETASAAAFQGSGMTLSQAVAQVRRQYGGRIVSAETKVSGGRETHVIKVLTDDGKVKTVRIPGQQR